MLKKRAYFFNMLSMLAILFLVTSCTPRASRLASVCDETMKGGATYVFQVINIKTHKIYKGWSKMGSLHARNNAFRRCYSETTDLNACRHYHGNLIKESRP